MPAALTTERTLERVHKTAHILTGPGGDYKPLLDAIGEARFVLLGEATHGTHEFYKARAEITKRLIREKGFTAIAWEADWPDALRVNRYIQGRSADQEAVDALGDFQRFPHWMWRNADILDFTGWLRSHNEGIGESAPKVGVYGLDLYSLHSSIRAVLTYLDKTDAEAARQARQRYACFEDFGEDPQTYGMTASVDRSLSCEDEAVQQLLELQRQSAAFLSRDGRLASDELFFAKQNAIVALEAERYYRAMYRGGRTRGTCATRTWPTRWTGWSNT